VPPLVGVPQPERHAEIQKKKTTPNRRAENHQGAKPQRSL
jgi:hypothetical protein